MFLRQIKLLVKSLIFLILTLNFSYSEVVKKIEITGNERISDETIKMFGSISVNQNIDKKDLNSILKNIYSSNFFEDVNISFQNNILQINVLEKPIIIDIIYNGIKSNELRNIISENRILKPRSSFDKNSLKKDETNILNTLKNSGYYFSKINSKIENLNNNKLNLIYDIDLGEKSKIKKSLLLVIKFLKIRS